MTHAEISLKHLDENGVIRKLLSTAEEVKKHSYSPYSNFPVGCAILCDDGMIFKGTNVENASYGGTVCAERMAIGAAVSSGYRKFNAIAISTDSEDVNFPCGFCRQSIIEFGDVIIYSASKHLQRVEKLSASELLPKAFTPADLEIHKK